MSYPTRQRLLELLAPREPPCISIYQPAHRQHPENRQDPIRFKNLANQVERSLRQKHPKRDCAELLAPLRKLQEDQTFWQQGRDGLALFAAAGSFEVFQLQRAVPELAVVADTFHVKPLVRYLQSADGFMVLALTRETAALYVGNRYVLDREVLPDDFPARVEQLALAERAQAGVSVASSSAGVGSPRMFRAHGKEVEDLQTEKFFRAVDRAVADRYSLPARQPLVLAALAENQALFRRVSKNTLLVESGVNANPSALPADALRGEAWKLIEPRYLARLAELSGQYATAAARQQGTADLADAARAALAGRVAVLLVEAERIVPGRIDPATGAIQPTALIDPGVDDMLDDLAEIVLRAGGDVVVVPKERMPTASGLAATFRY